MTRQYKNRCSQVPKFYVLTVCINLSMICKYNFPYFQKSDFLKIYEKQTPLNGFSETFFHLIFT